MKLKQGDRATFGNSQRQIRGRVYAVVGRHYLVAGDCGVVCNSYSDGMFRFNDHDIVDEEAGEPASTIVSDSTSFAGTFSL